MLDYCMPFQVSCNAVWGIVSGMNQGTLLHIFSVAGEIVKTCIHLFFFIIFRPKEVDVHRYCELNSSYSEDSTFERLPRLHCRDKLEICQPVIDRMQAKDQADPSGQARPGSG